MTNFKLILIVVFAVLGVGGVLLFAGIINIGSSGSNADPEGTVVVWGTVDNQKLRPFFDEFGLRNNKIVIQYVQKNESTFSDEIVEAIASSEAPDLILLSEKHISRLDNKITHIPYTTLPQRTFADTFITGTNIFLSSEGVSALPFAVDPMVMYYNRTLTEAEGIVQTPTSWQEFSDNVELLTKRTSDLSIIQNGTALGAYTNITHVKDILALLFATNGNSFITRDAIGPKPHFGVTATTQENNTAAGASEFFLAFSDQNADVYSWNAGEPQDRDAFIQGKLAYYFGFASEISLLRALNPNINFDVALPPRSTEGNPVTVGRFYGFAIPRIARNQTLSYQVATLLVNELSAQAFVDQTSTSLTFMPVRRSVLANRPVDDPYLSLFYGISLVARPWLDPNPAATDIIFDTFVSDISSGFLDIDQSLDKAAAQIQNI